MVRLLRPSSIMLHSSSLGGESMNRKMRRALPYAKKIDQPSCSSCTDGKVGSICFRIGILICSLTFIVCGHLWVDTDDERAARNLLLEKRRSISSGGGSGGFVGLYPEFAGGGSTNIGLGDQGYFLVGRTLCLFGTCHSEDSCIILFEVAVCLAHVIQRLVASFFLKSQLSFLVSGAAVVVAFHFYLVCLSPSLQHNPCLFPARRPKL
eukprot:CAMPEP_0117077258 /NCGR_PEP_ID=MMETSP0472-20121206/54469_1 /TAXON_ID=693140 ORGANISM="Tiarina fusus, Strain LIS" /NCGR_SAMPLE_ID=MMETSP0472 /ASSEMBLY_ACC=CAM_ASM_000603 /LENGTH=207 /DNA_ID=CAMNT_0004803509 /DNA_START=62 /DNA_END=685 /DNA_ORIENTATION=-